MSAPSLGAGSLIADLHELDERLACNKRKMEEENAQLNQALARHQKRMRKLQAERAGLEQMQAQAVAALQATGAPTSPTAAMPPAGCHAAGNGFSHHHAAPPPSHVHLPAMQHAVSSMHPSHASHARMQWQQEQEQQQQQGGHLAISPMGQPMQPPVSAAQFQQYQLPQQSQEEYQHQQYQQQHYQQHNAAMPPQAAQQVQQGPQALQHNAALDASVAASAAAASREMPLAAPQPVAAGATIAPQPPSAAPSSTSSLSLASSKALSSAVAAKEFVPRALQVQSQAAPMAGQQAGQEARQQARQQAGQHMGAQPAQQAEQRQAPGPSTAAPSSLSDAPQAQASAAVPALNGPAPPPGYGQQQQLHQQQGQAAPVQQHLQQHQSGHALQYVPGQQGQAAGMQHQASGAQHRSTMPAASQPLASYDLLHHTTTAAQATIATAAAGVAQHRPASVHAQQGPPPGFEQMQMQVQQLQQQQQVPSLQQQAQPVPPLSLAPQSPLAAFPVPGQPSMPRQQPPLHTQAPAPMQQQQPQAQQQHFQQPQQQPELQHQPQQAPMQLEAVSAASLPHQADSMAHQAAALPPSPHALGRQVNGRAAASAISQAINQSPPPVGSLSPPSVEVMFVDKGQQAASEGKEGGEEAPECVGSMEEEEARTGSASSEAFSDQPPVDQAQVQHSQPKQQVQQQAWQQAKQAKGEPRQQRQQQQRQQQDSNEGWSDAEISAALEASRLASLSEGLPTPSDAAASAATAAAAAAQRSGQKGPANASRRTSGRGGGGGGGGGGGRDAGSSAGAVGGRQGPSAWNKPGAGAAAAGGAGAAGRSSGGGGEGGGEKQSYDDLLEGDYVGYVRKQQGASPHWGQQELVEQDFPSLAAKPAPGPASASAPATNGKHASAAAAAAAAQTALTAAPAASTVPAAPAMPAVPVVPAVPAPSTWAAAAAASNKWGAAPGSIKAPPPQAGISGGGGGRGALSSQHHQQQRGGGVEEEEARCGLRVKGDSTPDAARRRLVQRQVFDHSEPHLKLKRTINVLDGLELHRAVLTQQEQQLIVDAVHRWVELGRMGRMRGRTFSAPKKWLPGKGRMTMQFGCCYNYATDNQGRPPGIIPEELVEPMPPLLMALCRRLTRWGVLPAAKEPNSAIINIYEAGDCIPPHVDSHDFTRPFCTLSLLSEQSIMFAQKLVPAGPGVFEAREGCSPALIPLPCGSCLVLEGQGGDYAMHCVPPVASRRISITLRRTGPEFDVAVAKELQSYERHHGPLRGFWEEDEADGRSSRQVGAITIK